MEPLLPETMNDPPCLASADPNRREAGLDTPETHTPEDSAQPHPSPNAEPIEAPLTPDPPPDPSPATKPAATQPSSPRRIAASRANGRLSRGPITPEGKARAARNAIRHGLLAESIVLNQEDAPGFLDLAGEIHEYLQPANPIARTLADDLAVSIWRRCRIREIETQTLNLAIEQQTPNAPGPLAAAALAFKDLADRSSVLRLIHRYETRFDRQMIRVVNLLRECNSPNNSPCQTNLIPDPNTPNPSDAPPPAPVPPSNGTIIPLPQTAPDAVPDIAAQPHVPAAQYPTRHCARRCERHARPNPSLVPQSTPDTPALPIRRHKASNPSRRSFANVISLRVPPRSQRLRGEFTASVTRCPTLGGFHYPVFAIPSFKSISVSKGGL